MVLYDGSDDTPKSPLALEGSDIEGAEFADIVTARPFNQRIDMRYSIGDATDEKVSVILMLLLRVLFVITLASFRG